MVFEVANLALLAQAAKLMGTDIGSVAVCRCASSLAPTDSPEMLASTGQLSDVWSLLR